MRKLLGWILVMGGLLLIGYPFYGTYAYERQQQELLEAFDQLGEMEEGAASDPIAAAPDKKQSPSLEGSRGMLKIEKVDLEMLVFEGATENELSRGAGMMEPKKDFAEHNVGLAGHRAVVTGKQFNRLDELEAGDEIQVVTKTETLHYRVMDTFVVHKTDVSVLENGEKPMLTLVTCTPLGSWKPVDRLIVQAELERMDRN